MNDDLFLLLTIIDLVHLEVSKVAVKIPSGMNEFPSWRFFREDGVHDAYADYFPELTLGDNHKIIDAVVIDDILILEGHNA